jgi:hypothetical protein
MITTTVSLVTRLITREILDNPAFFDYITTSPDVMTPGTDAAFLVEVRNEEKPGVFCNWAALIDNSRILAMNYMWQERDSPIRFWSECPTVALTNDERKMVTKAVQKFVDGL